MRRNRFVVTGLKIAAVIGFMLLAQPGQATNNPLGLFKNYFVTGDVASVGASIRGSGNSATNLSAVQTLDAGCKPGDAVHFDCVPQSVDGVNTDIIAAFLYWEVIEKTAKPSGAKGMALDPGVGHAPPNPNPGQGGFLSYSNLSFFGEPIGADHAAPCWSSGGGTGSSNGAPTLRVYRADFLRYLEVDPLTGQRIPFARVQLPDSGSNGAGVPLTEGASLVVVYRNYKLPFRGVVFYDGSFTMNNQTDSLNQTIYGFYEASELPADLKAKVTFIVGDGQANFPEILLLGTSPPMPNQFIGPSLLQTPDFKGFRAEKNC